MGALASVESLIASLRVKTQCGNDRLFSAVRRSRITVHHQCHRVREERGSLHPH